MNSMHPSLRQRSAASSWTNLVRVRVRVRGSVVDEPRPKLLVYAQRHGALVHVELCHDLRRRDAMLQRALALGLGVRVRVSVRVRVRVRVRVTVRRLSEQLVWQPLVGSARANVDEVDLEERPVLFALLRGHPWTWWGSACGCSSYL